MVNQPLSNQELLAECDRQLQSLKEKVQKAYERGLVDITCKSALEEFDLQVIVTPSSGSLIPSIRSEARKTGEVVQFPVCHGERGDPWTNRSNYYWTYQYRDKSKKLRNVYVARRKIEVVKEAIALKKTPEEIVRLIKSRKRHPYPK